MINLTPAPRPCSLWGETFEANDFFDFYHDSVYVTTESEPYSIHFLEVRLYSREFPLPKIQVGIGDFDEELVKSKKIEAITSIHNAMHPWLDIKHAVELGLIHDNERYAVLFQDGSWGAYYGFMLKHESNEGEGLIAVKPASWAIGLNKEAMAADRERFKHCRVAEIKKEVASHE